MICSVYDCRTYTALALFDSRKVEMPIFFWWGSNASCNLHITRANELLISRYKYLQYFVILLTMASNKRPLSEKELQLIANKMFSGSDTEDEVFSSGESVGDDYSEGENSELEDDIQTDNNEEEDIDEDIIEEAIENDIPDFVWNFDPSWEPNVTEFDGEGGCKVEELNGKLIFVIFVL